MKSEIASVAGSPVGSIMSDSSASNPGTPGFGHYRFANFSTSTGCSEMNSDSFDSDMENNNVFGLSATVKQENMSENSGLCDTTPKKKRYTKSRVRNRSPALVQKLKKTRRSKANDRERARMHNLNDALDCLRKILPNHGEENKLTKIETLRFAYNYIFALKQTLNMLDRGERVDIEDTLYTAQMSAAMKMPSASQTLAQLNQHQQQKQEQQHQQQSSQMSPVPVQPQLSPASHQNPLHPTPQGPLEAVTVPEISSPDQDVFHNRSQCYPRESIHEPLMKQFLTYPVHCEPSDIVPAQISEYTPYTMAGIWPGTSVADSLISYNCQTTSHTNSSHNSYSYVMVNNF